MVVSYIAPSLGDKARHDGGRLPPLPVNSQFRQLLVDLRNYSARDLDAFR